MKPKHLLLLILPSLGAVANSALAQEAAVSIRQDSTTVTSPATAKLTQSLKEAGPNAPAMAGPATAAAIRSLGPDATKKQVAAIVYAAVHTVPDSALNIVRAAVSAAPTAAPEIAAAAVRAVPNPWKEVRYQRRAPAEPATTPNPQPAPQPSPQATASVREPDFKSIVDSKSVKDLPIVLDPAQAGTPMTLAEAIVQAASDAGGNYADVQGAIDAALLGDPGALYNAVIGARGLSGVGTAGNSNYANEPHNSGGGGGSPGGGGKKSNGLQKPVPQPTPPAVSQ